MPRVIAGDAKGRRLKVPKGHRVRPTPARAREALFGILADRVPAARVLDLYCGSGALGIEALSRGAAYCLFVDHSQRALDCVRDNLAMCGFQDRARCLRRPLPQLDTTLGGPFSLVLSDPPYDDDPFGRLARGLAEIPGLITADVIWAHEVSSRRAQEPPGELGEWTHSDTRRYGDTTIWLLKLPPKGS